MARLGYARTADPADLERQRAQLWEAGAERIAEDVGLVDGQPGLHALLDSAVEGDTIIVVALDRLGRSLTQLVGIAAQLRHRGLVLRSLREGIDYSTVNGQVVADVLIALVDYERTLTSERAAVARQAARTQNRLTGRPRAIDAAGLRSAQEQRAAGRTVPQICADLGVSRATLYRAFAAQRSE